MGITPSLSPRHYHSVTITPSLSLRHYRPVTITPSLSSRHYHPVTITSSLSPRHYHPFTITLCSPCKAHQVVYVNMRGPIMPIDWHLGRVSSEPEESHSWTWGICRPCSVYRYSLIQTLLICRLDYEELTLFPVVMKTGLRYFISRMVHYAVLKELLALKKHWTIQHSEGSSSNTLRQFLYINHCRKLKCSVYIL